MNEDVKKSFEHWTSIAFDATTEEPVCIIFFDDESAAKKVVSYLQDCGDITMDIIEKQGVTTQCVICSESFANNKLPSLNIGGGAIPNIQSFLKKVPFDKPFPLVPMIVHSSQSSKLSPVSDYIVPVISYTYRKEKPISGTHLSN